MPAFRLVSSVNTARLFGRLSARSAVEAAGIAVRMREVFLPVARMGNLFERCP